ncbi:14218_t:CDS:2 [Gigaspora margarita]|uniref:14218_t:CDS:1 n=1 Tax=Gigaspora margarita TaxID=4874 RepID=A0ABN7UMI4_GIGMA|nr:14218_t:CDS:2 [Gigaspora margarita]
MKMLDTGTKARDTLIEITHKDKEGNEKVLTRKPGERPVSPLFMFTPELEEGLRKIIADSDEVNKHYCETMADSEVKRENDLDDLNDGKKYLEAKKGVLETRLKDREERNEIKDTEIRNLEEEIEEKIRGETGYYPNKIKSEGVKKKEKKLAELKKEQEERVKKANILVAEINEIKKLLESVEKCKENVDNLKGKDKESLFRKIDEVVGDEVYTESATLCEEELLEAQNDLLDEIKATICRSSTKDGKSVSFEEDEINKLKEKCAKYEKKAEAAGRKKDEYGTYINKLLGGAIKENSKLVILIKLLEERHASEREKVKLLDIVKERKIQELERANKVVEAKLEEAYRKLPKDAARKMRARHKRTDSGISIDLSSGWSTPDRPGTPIVSPTKDSLEKLGVMQDTLGDLKKKNDKEKADLAKGYEERIKALREELDELKKRAATENKPQTEEGEKCSVLVHALLEGQVKELKDNLNKAKEELNEKEIKIIELEEENDELKNKHDILSETKNKQEKEDTSHEKIHGKAEENYFKPAGKIELASPYSFYLAKNNRKSGDETKFVELLNLLHGAKGKGKTVFIPVNDANSPDGDGKHWSLLVYEDKKFYHFDSARGMNYKYVEDTVKDLLRQLGTPEIRLDRAIIKKHDIQQGDGVEAEDGAIVKKTFSKLDKEKIFARAQEDFKRFAKGVNDYDKGRTGTIEDKDKENKKISTDGESSKTPTSPIEKSKPAETEDALTAARATISQAEKILGLNEGKLAELETLLKD